MTNRRRRQISRCVYASLALVGTVGAARATEPRVLRVGPGRAFTVPSAAIAEARDGETIEFDAGVYANDVAQIRKNHLTIRGVGDGPAVMRTDGRTFGDKGIWVFADGCDGLTLENLCFEGARVPADKGANGAGLRSQGRDLTLRHCRFHDNQNGLLGGSGLTTIEHCEFDGNAMTGLTHNLYISDNTGTLIFRFNDSHDGRVGHLLKSRAAVNRIECNRLRDGTGGASYEIDLPNGGRCDIIGNLIEQGTNSGNETVLCYGEEGIVSPASELNVVSNTFVNRRGSATFVRVANAGPATKITLKNNLFAGTGATIAGAAATSAGNVTLAINAAGFADPAHGDYRLTAGSPAIGVAVPAGADSAGGSLTPVSELPSSDGPVPAQRPRRDAGAYARTP